MRLRYALELRVWVVLLVLTGGVADHAAVAGDFVTATLAVFVAACTSYCLREVTFREAVADTVDRAINGELPMPRVPR